MSGLVTHKASPLGAGAGVPTLRFGRLAPRPPLQDIARLVLRPPLDVQLFRNELPFSLGF